MTNVARIGGESGDPANAAAGGGAAPEALQDKLMGINKVRLKRRSCKPMGYKRSNQS